MDENEEEEAGFEPVEDTEMKDGNTSGVKLVERGGVGKPKSTKKKNKGKGGGKSRSRSPKVGTRDQKTVR